MTSFGNTPNPLTPKQNPLLGSSSSNPLGADGLANFPGLAGRMPLNPADPFGAVNSAEEGDCGTMLSRLYHFLDGELTDERRGAIARHLDGCTSCFSAYDFEAELRGVVANRLQVQVPPQLLARIQVSLKQEAIQLNLGDQGSGLSAD